MPSVMQVPAAPAATGSANPTHPSTGPQPRQAPEQGVQTPQPHQKQLRVLVEALWAAARIHQTEIEPTITECEAMAAVRRVRDNNVSWMVRAVEGFYCRDVVEQVTVRMADSTALRSRSPVPASVIDREEVPNLTSALHAPASTRGADPPGQAFVDVYKDVVGDAEAVRVKALCLGRELKDWPVLVTLAAVVALALGIGCGLGGPVVGGLAASVVTIFAGCFWYVLGRKAK